MGHVAARKRQPHPVFRRTLLARAARHIALGAVAAAPLLAVPVAAQAQAAARAYDIPAGTLEDALSRFGRDSGIMLSFKPEATAGRASNGLKGNYTPTAGLNALLANTGLVATQQANGNFLVSAPAGGAVPDGVATLPTTTVTASAMDGGLPAAFAGGQVARGGGLGILGTGDVMDTPFSTMNYTSELMQNQQARTLSDVVINEASVRTLTSSGGFGEDFQIRGFTVPSGDVGINGLYGMASGSRMPVEILERVEVLKGPGSLMYGISPNGSIGGAINVVTKRAAAEPLTRFTTVYQSKSQFGLLADVGRRFGEGKEWGVRFNGSVRDGNTAIDDGKNGRVLGALGLDYTGRKLRWSLDAYTQHESFDNFRPQIGTRPGTASLPDAPSGYRNFYPGTKLNLHDTAVMSRLEYDILPSLTVWGAGGYREGTAYQVFPSGNMNALGETLVNTSWYDSFSKTNTFELGARARFSTFGVGHTLTTTFTTLNQENGNFYLSGTTPAVPSSIYNPVPIPAMAGTRGDANKASQTQLRSVAITDTLSFLDDRLLLTGGLRHQTVKLDNYNTANGARLNTYDKDAVSPIAGIVVKPLQNLSLYGNYTKGLTRGGIAPATAANRDEVFPPYKSEQYEAGVKFDWSNKVTTTVSVFQIERPSAITDPATNIYSFDGEQRNRGLELSAYGEIVRGLRGMASATFYDAELTNTAGGTNNGKTANGVPKNAFNLGLEWDTPWVQGLSLNGRVIHTGRVYYNAANTISLPSYRRFDIGARYATKISGKSVVFRANVENLFNSRYWMASGTYLAAAAPRTVILSAQFDF